MALFSYRAINPSGIQITGTIDAPSMEMAGRQLRDMGVFPIEIRSEEKGKGIGELFGIFRRVRGSDLATFTFQLSVLLGAGLPLASALGILVEQTENNALKNAIKDVRERIRAGSSFHEALSHHPRIFSRLYVDMVRAGEASGALTEVISRLASFAERDLEIRSNVRAALTYPAIIVVFGICAVSFLLVFVIPRLTSIFSEVKQSLPLPTLILLSLSSLVKEFWWVVIALLAVAFLGLRGYGRTSSGRLFIDGLKLRIPVIGKLIRLFVIGRFCRTLGTLLNGGVPMLEALGIVMDTAGNEVIRRAIMEARRKVERGEGLSEPLRESGAFPPMVVRMIAVGEETAELENILFKIADAYDVETERYVKRVTTLLEPVLLLLLGVAVGFVVISILLPIFQMSALVGK
jgi:type II secretion system protein F